MSTKDNGGPAFPVTIEIARHDSVQGGTASGMTLRDYFASAANDKDIAFQISFHGSMSRAAARYKHADSMIEERQK